jgi:crotonobetainyl-CoA:carnitine CoA-transferase CaiB-like acyl-CoA transferase
LFTTGITLQKGAIMSFSRRKFVHATSVTALGVAMTSKPPGIAQAEPPVTTFDIRDAFAAFMKDLGESPSDGGGAVTFTGRDPILRSHFRVGACMAIPAMAAGVGAAAIWKERTGEGQEVKVDLREAIYNTNPAIAIIMQKKRAAGLFDPDDPVPGTFTFVPTINGLWYQAPLLFNSPLSFAILPTKDGRWVTPTVLYPQHLYGFLTLINAPPNAQAIAKTIQQWNSKALDDTVASNGYVLGLHRTQEEWARHPEGQHLAKIPVIEIVKINDTDPIPFKPNPVQPLSGVKVLSLTHVIAGNCAARTLAEYGGDVLHIARDQAFEHEILHTDLNLGMRSSFVDLKNPAQNKAFSTLVPDADVFIEGFRGRAMEKLGFGVQEVAARRPGVIYLTVRCYSWDGPWCNRPGFDMEALTVSGYTIQEAGAAGRRPSFPPTMVLNDFIAGYMGAAGVIAALRRRAREGGSYHVRVSLTRAAMWFMSLGSFPTTTDFDPHDPEHRMIEPETMRAQTPYGEVHRLAPQAKLSKTPGRWRTPLLVVRGSDRPVWGA